MATQTIGFIGAGNMATTMAMGLLEAEMSPEHVYLSNRSAEKLQPLAKLGMQTTQDNKAVAKDCDVVVLAVKPYQVADVCREISASLKDNAIIISVAAGVSAAFIKEHLGRNLPVFIAMPNVASAVGAGVTGVVAPEDVSDDICDEIEDVLSMLGMVVWLEDEAGLPAITAISGSGIAYFFKFMSCMEQGAAAFGLPDDVTRFMVAQTALGAAKMAIESEESNEILCQRVASPGGATAAGLTVMDDAKLSATMQSTMQAVIKRFLDMADETCNS